MNTNLDEMLKVRNFCYELRDHYMLWPEAAAKFDEQADRLTEEVWFWHERATWGKLR